MTTETLERLRSQISTLSPSERATLAHELSSSLDGVRDDAVEQTWNEEIMRRIAQIETGQTKLLTREQFRERMRNRIGT